MVAESLQYHPSTLSSSSSLPNPPQNQIPVESFIGSFISLTSNYGLRYEGVLYHLNLYDSMLVLLNVRCYGTEGRNNIGFQIAPSNDVYNYIIFRVNEIKEYILVKPPPTSFTRCLARSEATCSKLSHATKPPLPLIFTSHNQHGAKIHQKVPLISNEELSKTQATTLLEGPVSDIASDPLAQPQYPGSNFYDPWSIPVDDGALYQALIKTASGLVIPPQSFFTTFPPVPISLRQSNGGIEFEALSKNFMQYELWVPPQESNNQTANTIDGLRDPPQENKNQGDANTIDGLRDPPQENKNQGDANTIDGLRDPPQENKNQEDANTIDGSFYMISRNPFDPMGKPCNPTFGPIGKRCNPVAPIARPVNPNLKRRHQRQPPFRFQW